MHVDENSPMADLVAFRNERGVYFEKMARLLKMPSIDLATVESGVSHPVDGFRAFYIQMVQQYGDPPPNTAPSPQKPAPGRETTLAWIDAEMQKARKRFIEEVDKAVAESGCVDVDRFGNADDYCTRLGKFRTRYLESLAMLEHEQGRDEERASREECREKVKELEANWMSGLTLDGNPYRSASEAEEKLEGDRMMEWMLKRKAQGKSRFVTADDEGIPFEPGMSERSKQHRQNVSDEGKEVRELALLRNRAGLSIEHVAKWMGLPVGAVEAIENGLDSEVSESMRERYRIACE